MQINKYQHLTILLSIFLLASCNQEQENKSKKQKQTAQAPKKEQAETPVDSIKSKGKTIFVSADSEPSELILDSISEAEFNKLKAVKFLRSIKPKRKGNEFFIETAVRRHTFKQYKDYGEPKNWCGYELAGYYPNLKLYALTENSTAEHMGFGELFLLDSITDYRYTIPSIGDGSVEIPIPSPSNKYLVYYYNWVYDHHNSELGVLKINSKNVPEKHILPHASYSSETFAVEQIIWKSDTCFYLKGYEEIYDETSGKWIREFSYYKFTFN